MATHANAKPSHNATDQTPNVPFMPLLAGLIAWPILKLFIEWIVGLVNPQFLEDLKMNPRRGYDLYFGVWLGTLFKIFSISACIMALFTTSAETDIVGLVRPLNTAEQVCWGCRAIIYIQELPHISSIPELVIHHVLSVCAMIAIWAFNIPRRQLYIAWGGLFSEFVSNARRLLKLHSRCGPRLNWWLTTANVILIMVFRVTGCFVALVWTLQSGIRGVSLIIDVASWTIYLFYMLDVSIGEAMRNRLITFDMKPPARITIAETFQMSPLGIILGLGFVATELSAILLYEFTGNHISSMADLRSIAWVALQAAVAGVIGSYVTPQIGDFMFSGFKRALSSTDKVPCHEGCSMQGALIFAALTIRVSPTMADKAVHIPSLVACMAISWPLLITVNHVAQYFHGGRPDDTSILPVHLIAALLGGISYLSLLVALLSGIIANLYQVAVLAICLEITMRRVVDHRRADATNPILPWLQLVGCLSLLSHTSFPEDFKSLNPIRSDVKKLVAWSVIVTIYHLFFEGIARQLSKPALPASPHLDTKPALPANPHLDTKQALPASPLLDTKPALPAIPLLDTKLDVPGTPSRGGKKRNNRRSRNKEAVEGTTTTTAKVITKRLNLKAVASTLGLALVLLIFWALYLDKMPKAITEIDSGSGTTGERALGGERFQFFMEAVSSWQVIASTAAVAALPVVLKA